jgi:hypothetical protein
VTVANFWNVCACRFLMPRDIQSMRFLQPEERAALQVGQCCTLLSMDLVSNTLHELFMRTSSLFMHTRNCKLHSGSNPSRQIVPMHYACYLCAGVF